jgi:biotin carboxylase
MNSKKQILILGAGLMQRPAIESAKELGFFTNVIDANPNAVAVSNADRFEKIDLKDREAVRDFALSLKRSGGLDAVFTAGTDFSASVSFAARACGLPSHSFDAALNASDKIRMRGCFAKYGVPSPAFYEVDSRAPDADGSDTLEAAVKNNTFAFPLVVKPVDNMGARGCRLARDEREFRAALADAAASSRSGRVIVEEYMDGPEFSVDALVYNDTLTVTGFADRHIFYPPYFIEMGHTLPSACSKADFAALVAAFAKGVSALGLTCGAAKGDIKLTKNGPMIGEIAGRLSGGYMSGWTFPYASDCNLTREAILIAAGETPRWLEEHRTPIAVESNFAIYEIPAKRTSAERAWISIPGRVKEAIMSPENAAFVRDVLPRTKAGDTVTFPRNNVEKCGNVIAVADTRVKATESALAAVKSITLRLEPGNPETDRFLAGEILETERGFPPDAFQIPIAIRAELESQLGGVAHIPADQSVLSYLPECLTSLLDSLEDWNHLTLREALVRFDALCPRHRALPAARFWRACIRGSIQGCLYFADTIIGYEK